MADISVRKIRFTFEEPLDFDVSDEMLGSIIPMLGLSMTMPHLEPYLIRTMRVAIPQITDPQLAEDARRFSQQEGHHYRNHAKLNEQICASFEPATADELRAIEQAMEDDYQRFTKQKPLRFNVAYAEGFEAMTCSSALAMAEAGNFDEGAELPGGEIWAWHMAEEIEHRTVAFGVFDHLVGSYLYRIAWGTWAQWHYLSYIRRFSLCMARGLGRKLTAPSTPMNRAVLRRYLRTWSPRYDPAKIEIPAGVDALLARYSAMAEHS
jgi:predicted metal-dependent hydrolase